MLVLNVRESEERGDFICICKEANVVVFLKPCLKSEGYLNRGR